MAAGPENQDRDSRERLQALSQALERRRREERQEPPGGGPSSPQGVGQAVSLGFRVMSEFVAAVVVGGVIGWLLDRWLGSSPFALILFIGLGTAAGFWSVYRIATGSTGRRGRT